MSLTLIWNSPISTWTGSWLGVDAQEMVVTLNWEKLFIIKILSSIPPYTSTLIHNLVVSWPLWWSPCFLLWSLDNTSKAWTPCLWRISSRQSSYQEIRKRVQAPYHVEKALDPSLAISFTRSLAVNLFFTIPGLLRPASMMSYVHGISALLLLLILSGDPFSPLGVPPHGPLSCQLNSLW